MPVSPEALYGVWRVVTESLIVSAEMAATSIDIGTAYFSRRRNTLATSFLYRDGYLAFRDAYAIDPELELYSGSQWTDGLPGAFADCAPDRWGKNLIAKKVQAEALQEGYTPPRTP